MCLNDSVHDPVKTEHIAVRHFPLSVGRQHIGPEVCDRAVDIPLHIIDIRAVKNLVYAFDKVVLNLAPTDVESKLITASDSPSARNLHRPVRMCSEEIRILADHLRLEPDAEFQTEVVDLLYQRREPAFDLFLVDVPIAKT